MLKTFIHGSNHDPPRHRHQPCAYSLMPIHDPWHHQAGGALLSHQHHCPLDVSKTLKGTKAATFERQSHIGRHSCHHLDPLPCPSPTSLCPCPCQIMQGVTMLCALLLDVSCARAHCAHHILVLCAPKHNVHIKSWCYVHPSTLPLGRQRTTSTSSTAAVQSGLARLKSIRRCQKAA